MKSPIKQSFDFIFNLVANNTIKQRHKPSKVIRDAVHFAQGKGIVPADAPDTETPLEELGILIGIFRRRRRLSQLHLANKIGCSVEELVAIENGLLPMSHMEQRLLSIQREIHIPNAVLQPLIQLIKSA